MLSTAETVMRPAAAALDEWLPATGPIAIVDSLALEQRELARSITRLVGLMDDEGITGDQLDELTDEIAVLLMRAEEMRVAASLTDAAAEGTWTLAVDLP